MRIVSKYRGAALLRLGTVRVLVGAAACRFMLQDPHHPTLDDALEVVDIICYLN
jgi:hypothetical protein